MELRILKPDDITQSYVDWMEDKEVIRYSENQYRNFSIDSQKKYVTHCLYEKDIDLYGIFINSKHVGNICLKGLTSKHKRAEVTYLIGVKNLWGKGLGYEVLANIIYKAKKEYKLKKLYAGVASENIASKKVLEKNKFKLEGIRKDHLFLNNVFMDQLDFGLIL
tara:strand:+ start:113 stop:604 length:492 start_codon:yes stop_codon:yes gene_type:complete